MSMPLHIVGTDGKSARRSSALPFSNVERRPLSQL